MNAIAFIKKYATAGIALAAVLGFSAFKSVTKIDRQEDLNLKNEVKTLVNPQWFSYTGDPNHPNFNTDKLDPSKYAPTGNSNIGSRPCPSSGDFCGIFAETVMDGTQEVPNLSVGQPVRTELDSYSNGAGESTRTYIDEQG